MDPLTIIMAASAIKGLYDQFSGSHKKSAYNFEKHSTTNKEQKKTLKKLYEGLRTRDLDIKNQPLFQQGSGYLQNLLSNNPEAYKNFEAPYLKQFNEEIIPNLANRFSMFDNQQSSAFQQALAREGSNLSERLATLRSGLQLQSIPTALGYAQQPVQGAMNRANMILGKEAYSGTASPRNPSFFDQISGGLGQGLGTAASIQALNQYQNTGRGGPVQSSWQQTSQPNQIYW